MFALNVIVTLIIVGVAILAAAHSFILLALAMWGNEKPTRKFVLTEGGAMVVFLVMAFAFLAEGIDRNSDWVCEDFCTEAGATTGEEKAGSCACFDELAVGKE